MNSSLVNLVTEVRGGTSRTGSQGGIGKKRTHTNGMPSAADAKSARTPAGNFNSIP